MIGIIGIVLIFTGFLISIVLLIASKNNHNVPSPKKNNGKYAILIPARNESKVIEDLLISIENQTRKIKAGDVYVQGNVTEDVFPKLKAEMQYIANSEINKFVKYVNGQ